MTPDEAIKEFKSVKDLCKALKISTRNFYRWVNQGWISQPCQNKIEKLTNGRLKADEFGNDKRPLWLHEDQFKEGDTVYWIGQNQQSDSFGVYPLNLVFKEDRLMKIHEPNSVSHGRFCTDNFSFNQNQIYKSKKDAINALLKQLKTMGYLKKEQE